ncbi:hypothetical protein H696_02251 [Fonticula alba]|uniref:Cytochrome c oxidase subunit 6a n=1 Tax=Fonticula alba TaxID=691883 RepID=A0A058ZAF7_FONAL|nr:hypothetical protein H696_02251 [Fonticula alba]KCV71305.1 hypothetical protein H696_02251 [Fonticula alba]|eukprot:XP_009494428.1 hypothetical protein H696_02251 [Fonticula alba]
MFRATSGAVRRFSSAANMRQATKYVETVRAGPGRPTPPMLESERAAIERAAIAANLWYKLTWFGAIPFTFISAAVIFANLEHQHLDETNYVAYPYLNWHLGPFPFGNGLRSLFWNDNNNYNPALAELLKKEAESVASSPTIPTGLKTAFVNYPTYE